MAQVLSIDGTTKNEELITQTPIDNTPFVLYKHDNKYFVAFGKYRLTDLHPNAEEAINEGTNLNWHTITRLCLVLNDVVKRKDVQELFNSENLNNLS
jgi:hypothetical protein